MVISGPYWSESGKNAVVVINAFDNKDRWIMKLDPVTGNLTLVYREHNDAWVDGPGIGNYSWIDDTHYYFESEASGYAHIYVADVVAGTEKQITSGKWEVQTLKLSADRKNFYFTANIEHPGITNFYRVPVNGGDPVQLTSMKGMSEITVSPDE